MYKSNFTPNNEALSILRSGKIIDESESGSDMIERVVRTLAYEELKFSPDSTVLSFAKSLGDRMDDGRIIMSTTILTNAGRYPDRPLGACTMPVSNLSQDDLHILRHEIDALHEQGMGTGFNLNSLKDPVAMLRSLNDFAVQGAKREEENRPVGNMAVLSVYHPKILDFIRCKVDSTDCSRDWKFNISIDLDDNFFNAIVDGDKINLMDGTTISANKVFDEICEAAKRCADPGILFLDRLNSRNPIPGLGSYKTTAPCAEVGLVEGESCQFGYINAGKFIETQNGTPRINYADLEETVKILTKALDNALSISIDRYTTPRSSYIMQQKRKIGIGLCGVADAISMAGFSYESENAKGLIAGMLSFINYVSKEASIVLAEQRGPALSMLQPVGNRYYDNIDYLSSLYGNQLTTGEIEGLDWIRLGRRIKENGLLRNTTTVALPPTGRSALIYGASTGIEPHFSLERIAENVRNEIAKHVGRFAGKVINSEVLGIHANRRETDIYLACAQEIDPSDHLDMVSCLQQYTDESISKTINMPAESTINDVADIYLKAYNAGTSGITIYIDGSHTAQPVALNNV